MDETKTTLGMGHRGEAPPRSAFLSIAEVCELYGISRSTFYRMLADPKSGLRAVVVRIPPPRGRVRVPVEAFEAWLRRRQTA